MDRRSTLRKLFFRLALLPLFVFLVSSTPYRPNSSLISIGGGYFFGGSNHSGSLLQVEYKWEHRFFNHIRPQATVFFPELKGFFVGIGAGLECYFCKNFIFIPSFEPGLYYKGGSRDLGCPVEFRSSVEFAYENDYGFRLGCQFFHVSNAHLGHHNPGANAIIIYLGMPVSFFSK